MFGSSNLCYLHYQNYIKYFNDDICSLQDFSIPLAYRCANQSPDFHNNYWTISIESVIHQLITAFSEIKMQ